MYLSEDSRYMLGEILWNAGTGAVYTDLRVTLDFRSGDEQQIEVRVGDTLWNVAHRAYPGAARGTDFWWAIADFQPDPIIDPTITLTVGSLLAIPPPSYIQGALQDPSIFGEEDE